MNVFRKTAVAVLAAAALTGIGAGVASAAPATNLTGGQQDVRFFNASPYRMFVARVDQGLSPMIQDIEPGQSATMSDAQLAGLNGQLEVGEIDNAQNVADIDAISVSGYQPGVAACQPVPGRSNAPEMGCLVQTPNVLAGESGPMQVSIWTLNPKHNGATTNLDANAGDKVAMGNWLSGLAALNPAYVTFDPNVDTVGWGYGPQAQAGPAVWNCGAGNANETIGGGATHEESTNVTGTFSITQSNLPGGLPGVSHVGRPGFDRQRVGGIGVAVPGRGDPVGLVPGSGRAESGVGLGPMIAPAGRGQVRCGGRSLRPGDHMIQVAADGRGVADRVGADRVAEPNRGG